MQLPKHSMENITRVSQQGSKPVLSKKQKTKKILRKLHPQAWRKEKKIWLPRHAVLGEKAGGLPPVILGRLGSLEVRLARTPSEVRRAQRLRYQVFYEEMGATPDAAAMILRRDADEFDVICDHLLVIDHDSTKVRFGVAKPEVVGTYRVLRQDIAEQNWGFYSAQEFDIAPLLARHRGLRFMELGRSCVVKRYRSKRTVELLWQGIWSYVRHHNIDVMIGCASLEGTSPDDLALPLSFLHHKVASDDQWRVKALPHRAITMDRLPASCINDKDALHALPPLLKGYLRVGAKVGEDAVIDHQFGTTDVFVVLPVAQIPERYKEHFTV